MLSGFTRYLSQHIFAKISPMFAFLEPAVDQLIKNGGEILTNTALSVVTQIASDPSVLTNADKRNKAVQLVADTLKAQGIAAAESAVNLAVEGAVAELKSAVQSGS
jgi:hypothetical protein